MRDTLNEVIDPIVYDEALELIRQHQARGHRVYLVSASPEEIVTPLALYLGVDEAIASRAELDEAGRYTGEVEFYNYGPSKAEAILAAAAAHDIDLSRSYAYSDSATDLPMLEVVGHPVAVNPDRDLARVARQRELGGAPVPQRRAPAPARAHAGASPDGDGCGGLGGGRRGRHRVGVVAAATGGARAHHPRLARSRPPDSRPLDGAGPGGRARPQASWSFFTAKAASATTTTRTRSFFMRASLGAAHPIAPNDPARGGRHGRVGA